MILAVTGGKGGVGKSTVAFNLGASLDAVVVDGDLGMADLPSGNGPDLHDVLAGRADVHEAISGTGDVPLLPCGRTLSGARATDPTGLVEVAETLVDEYGTVVIDCPAGTAADVGLPLHAADASLIVTMPERPALTAAIRIREMARALDAGLIGIALNRAGPDPATDAIRRTLGAPVTPIPDSTAVSTAQSCGRPIQAMAPGSPAALRFKELAVVVHSCTS